jgi:putative ATP-dependent endonuclease of OLD family
MYLKEFGIKNFRSIKNMDITLNKKLNIFIGPNNSGKTTIIDALYFCFHYKDYNRSKRISLNDFYKGVNSDKNVEDIEFSLKFEIQQDFEIAVFLDLYNPEDNSLDLYFKFHYNEKLNKIQSFYYGGANKDNPVHSEIFDSIFNIYLGPLRDAERYLTSGKPNIIGKLFSKVVSDEKKEEWMDELNKNIDGSKLSKFIKNYNNEHIQNYLNELIFNDDEMDLSMLPMEQDFDKFTQYWNIKIPFSSENNNSYLDLSQNGLGYNNLIYISVLLSYLDVLGRKEETRYISLFIEEPEAHLHPQLQNLFLSYMNKLNDDNNIQIFITTHSPTLTSKADLNDLILVQNKNNEVICSNLRKLFNKENTIFLKKFLDVTKSQLLFSKKIIFVEGITESILVPLFAEKYCDFNLDENGVEVVNVNGINFKNFIPLFKKSNNLNYVGVILTDKDEENIGGPPSKTYTNLKDILENSNVEYNLKIFGSNKTFEYDLITTNDFNPIIWNVFKNKHPGIFKIEKNNESLFKVFKDNHKISKADIALKLYDVLKESNDKIEIPSYIKGGIDFLKGVNNGCMDERPKENL